MWYHMVPLGEKGLTQGSCHPPPQGTADQQPENCIRKSNNTIIGTDLIYFTYSHSHTIQLLSLD